MTKQEHLLTILVEECLEVAQRATKALRFSLPEIQPTQPFSNAERIQQEFADLIGAYGMLVDEGCLSVPDPLSVVHKKAKILEFLDYSRDCGTLKD